MSKQLLYNEKSRQAILRGVETLADAVKVTLGPCGRNVVMKRIGTPLVTKDGVTVAKEINLKNDFEDMGAQLVKEAAEKTSDAVGDGTSTSTILTEAIFREGIKHITSGANPMDIKSGMDKALKVINKRLDDISKTVDNSNEIAQVGTIASNGDADIGKIIAEAVSRVGKNGVITIKEAMSINTSLEVVEGMQFKQGYVSPHFANEKTIVELKDPYILLYEGKIDNIKDIMTLLERIKSKSKPLLIICDDVHGNALPILILNNANGVLKNCCVRAPHYGDQRKMSMEDISVLIGGVYNTVDCGLELNAMGLQHLGQASKVIITKDTTTIINGCGNTEKINNRIAIIKDRLNDVSADYDKDILKNRLAKLSSGIAVISVGAATETEMLEKKARVEDALHATKAAIEDGIIAGGGVALLRCVKCLGDLDLKDDEKIAITILKNVLSVPIKQIIKNAGKVDSSVIIANIKENSNINFGYDAKMNKHVDMIDVGIIDPTKVTKTALQNAISIATTMLTTEVLITDYDENNKNSDIVS